MIPDKRSHMITLVNRTNERCHESLMYQKIVRMYAQLTQLHIAERGEGCDPRKPPRAGHHPVSPFRISKHVRFLKSVRIGVAQRPVPSEHLEPVLRPLRRPSRL
jgi:hypothetical protein